MKVLNLLFLVILASCAHDRRPSSVNGNPIAYDSMALGNVKAEAVRRADAQEICFDIKLTITGTKQENVLPSNWTVAVVDKNQQYHLLKNNQRDPASVPQGGQIVAQYGTYQEWSNNFIACAPRAKVGDVKSLVLTPKHLPFKDDKGLELKWN